MKIKGIIHVTGEHDTGKTTFALEYLKPEETTFIHDDVKHPGDYGFKQEVDLTEFQDKLLDFKVKVLGILETLEPTKVLVVDTWSRFGQALRLYGKQNAHLFRERETFSAMGRIKGGEEWQEAHRYEARILAELQRKFETIFIITHLKNEYKGNVVTGREIPNAGKSLDRVCRFRIWLRHNPKGPVPIGLVLKRPDLKVVDPDTGLLRTVNVLPRRLEPLETEVSLWDSIRRYELDPMHTRKPTEAETPTPFELSILDGILTDDQKQVWNANLKIASQENLQLISQEALIKSRIKELFKEKNGALQEITDLLNQDTTFNGRVFEVSEVMQLAMEA